MLLVRIPVNSGLFVVKFGGVQSSLWIFVCRGIGAPDPSLPCSGISCRQETQIKPTLGGFVISRCYLKNYGKFQVYESRQEV